MSSSRLSLCGLGFVIALIGSIIVGGATPDPAASGDAVLAFYGDDPNRARITTTLLSIAIPLLVLFGSALASYAHSRGASPGVGLTVVRIGTALSAGMLALLVVIHLSLADSGDSELAGTTMQTLNVLDSHVVYGFAPALGTMLLGAASCLLVLNGRIRLLGWTALGISIVAFVPMISVLGVMLALLWIVAASITLSRPASTTT